MKSTLYKLSVAIYLTVASQAYSTTYYVSSSTGSDSNSGTTTLSAWQTLNKLSVSSFSAGDIIRFKCGDTFSGHAWNITSTGNNSISGLITAATYGSGAKPCLDATGMPTSEYTTTTISTPTGSGSQAIPCLINVSPIANYWKFDGLKFINSAVGIHCYNPSTTTPTQTYFNIHACDFSSQSVTGIRFYAESGKSINQVTIASCNFSSSNNGIRLTRCSNISISNSSLSEMDGGAISITDTTNSGVMQNCKIWNTGKVYKASGSCAVYLANTRNLTIDTCSIAYTLKAQDTSTSSVSLSPDGVAIDFESANKTITVSNCLIHDNDGAAFLIYRNPTFGFENRPLYFIGNTVYGNGRKGAAGGAPGGAQFIRHLQEQISSPGESASIVAGYGGTISGNTITLSNGTICNVTQTHSFSSTNNFPGWYEDSGNTISP